MIILDANHWYSRASRSRIPSAVLPSEQIVKESARFDVAEIAMTIRCTLLDVAISIKFRVRVRVRVRGVTSLFWHSSIL